MQMKINIVLINMITILIVSAKLVTPGLFNVPVVASKVAISPKNTFICDGVI